MPKFIAVTDEPEDAGPPKIKFQGYVDADGDFVIEANGAQLGFFANSDGKFHLMHGVPAIPGLATRGGKIVVSR